MELKTIQFSTHVTTAGYKIGIIKINRPEALNAINKQVLHDLKILVHELEVKPDWRAILLTGAGEKAFVAGADLKEMENLNPSMARELSLAGQALFQRIEDLPFPVIAALNGFALGGGLELALCCDFILASRSCRWGLPEVTLGLIPGYGGTQRLNRLLGPNLAKRVALSGEMFTAQQGYEWGVLAQLFEPSELWAGALKIAETIAQRAPRAVSWVKESIHHAKDKSFMEGIKHEAELFGRTFETKDSFEGIQSFLTKRPPQFQGH